MRADTAHNLQGEKKDKMKDVHLERAIENSGIAQKVVLSGLK